ncbi:MAG: glycosyltransferase family 4 protein [Phycisphaerales bacterium]
MTPAPLCIALVSREFPPFVGGGIGTYTRCFAEALAAGGHRPVVVTVSDDGAERRGVLGGVSVIRLPFIAGDDWSGPHAAIATPETAAAFLTFAPVSVFSMVVARALPRLMDEFRFDAIEAPDTGALGWFALNERRIGRPWAPDGGPPQPPLLTMVHSPTRWIAGLNGAPPPARRGQELLSMERDSARWSDAVLAPSTAMARWAEREWALDPGSIGVTAYPLGSLEAGARRSSQRVSITGELRRVAFVGRLERRKGVDTLLAAFAVAAENSDLRLDLIGQDTNDPATSRPFGAALLDALPEGLCGRITWHGRTPPETVTDLLVRSAVAVVPSPTDNFPYACIEAMAAGRIVVAARAGGMGELIRDGIDGFLFTPGDAGSLAAQLARAAALAADTGAELGRAAARRVLNVCGNERIVAARVGHYRGVIARERPTIADDLRTAADAVVLVNAPPILTPAVESLVRAVSRPGGGIDFAHGWSRSPDGTVLAFGTPTAESLARSPRRLGPLAVSRAALDDPRVRAFVEPASNAGGPYARFRAASTWEIASALCAGGYAGAVVPHAVTDLVSGAAESPEMPVPTVRVGLHEQRHARP